MQTTAWVNGLGEVPMSTLQHQQLVTLDFGGVVTVVGWMMILSSRR